MAVFCVSKSKKFPPEIWNVEWDVCTQTVLWNVLLEPCLRNGCYLPFPPPQLSTQLAQLNAILSQVNQFLTHFHGGTSIFLKSNLVLERWCVVIIPAQGTALHSWCKREPAARGGGGGGGASGMCRIIWVTSSRMLRAINNYTRRAYCRVRVSTPVQKLHTQVWTHIWNSRFLYIHKRPKNAPKTCPLWQRKKAIFFTFS